VDLVNDGIQLVIMIISLSSNLMVLSPVRVFGAQVQKKALNCHWREKLMPCCLTQMD